MRAKIAVLLLIFAATFAFADEKVNQGAPGNQGAWPVRIATPVFPTDGGSSSAYSSVSVYPYPCATTSPNKITYMDGGVQNVPATGASNRLYTVVTNSKENTTGTIKCRADGTNPSATVGTAGDVLGVGDAIPYTNPSGSPIKCIGSGLYVTTFECQR